MEDVIDKFELQWRKLASKEYEQEGKLKAPLLGKA